MKRFVNHLLKPSSFVDLAIISALIPLMFWNPYYKNGNINLFEVGLYLPGIDAILNGQVPYRDFFHLRGPLELYPVAFLMDAFGEHINILYTYFYIGNLLCLIFLAWLGKELLQTRLMLYSFILATAARTFPRVVYMFWGGMRYAWGILALVFIIKYFKHQKWHWMLSAGCVTALALLTSVEIGVYVILGIVAAFLISLIFKIQPVKAALSGFGWFLGGLSLALLPFLSYLYIHGALFPYIESMLFVVLRMQEVIDPHYVSVYPRNFIEAVIAMINPNHTNFKHMTPSYLYILLLIYLGIRLKQKLFSKTDLGLVCLGVYGFVMYNTGFRGIWAAQFEMSLMPEKVLYFFLLETLCLVFISFGGHRKIGSLLLAVIFVSSIGYTLQRLNHRYYSVKSVRYALTGKKAEQLKPLWDQPRQSLGIPRAKGIETSAQQAQELEGLFKFFQDKTQTDDIVLAYPDFATYNFLIGRPFMGRFPIATFSWFNEKWHEEFMNSLRSHAAQYIILPRELPKGWAEVHLAPEANRKKYEETMALILNDYALEHSTLNSDIYRLK